MKHLCYIVIFLFSGVVIAQDKELKQVQEDAKSLVVEGNDLAEAEAFVDAEAVYRKAIAYDPESVPAKYNMGSLYYKNQKFEESTQRLIQAAEVAQTKEEKHEAFHNLGNAFFKQKDFKQAVEAYKNALRNNPTDEETRYNLALAKQEEEQDGGGGDDQNEDQNQDQNDNQDGDGDQQESDDGEEQETDDEGEEKEDPNQEGEDEKDQGKPDEQKHKDGGKEEQKQQPPPPQPGQLSPQQVKNLLEAINNQEEQTQEKVNAQKVKGAQVKTEKDW
ncbi:tetratricopeptide repeat protein [Croceiramulus getboli]|nr:tetratricopeptide repeat protein [Flavobacteriaceae bacterium YJPT1-3]